MPKIVTVSQMMAVEFEADASGYSYAQMMQSAGMRVAEFVRTLIPNDVKSNVTVLVGKGKNGGDGLVAASELADSRNLSVTCFLLDARAGDSLAEDAKQAGVKITHLADPMDETNVLAELKRTNVLVDALLGTGARLPLDGRVQRLLELLSSVVEKSSESSRLSAMTSANLRTIRRARPLVIAVDCPTGLNCDTGELDSAAVLADYTVTFAAAKYGQIRLPGATAVGKLIVADIGIPTNNSVLNGVDLELLSLEDAAKLLPTRNVDGHKGTFGIATIVAGSANLPGAAALAGRAAYRVGAGLVRMAVPEPVKQLLVPTLLEATWNPIQLQSDLEGDSANAQFEALRSNTDAYLVGPGLGRDKLAEKFLLEFLELLTRNLSSDESHLPRAPGVVVDADGLNILASRNDWTSQIPPNSVLTPHVGEMSRISGIEKAIIQQNRIDIAFEKAKEWNAVVVLKGAFTVIASPNNSISVSPFASDALAKAGTGDVLAGMVVGFLAQGCDAFTAARLAVYLHGLAGTLCAKRLGSRSVIATDLIETIPLAIQQLELGLP